MKVSATTFPSNTGMPPELKMKIPAERLEIINRLVRATGLADSLVNRQPIRVSRSWHPLQIKQRQADDLDYRINAPYGMVGLALNADAPTLRRMSDYCNRKKYEFTQLGDYDTARLFGNRQAMIDGILSHLTTISLL